MHITLSSVKLSLYVTNQVAADRMQSKVAFVVQIQSISTFWLLLTVELRIKAWNINIASFLKEGQQSSVRDSHALGWD